MAKKILSLVPTILMVVGFLQISVIVIIMLVMTRTQALFSEFGVDTRAQSATMTFINVTLSMMAIVDLVYGMKLSMSQRTKTLEDKQRRVGVFLLIISTVFFVFMIPSVAVSVMGTIYSLSAGF